MPGEQSAMRQTMWRQPADLESLLADAEPAERVAERIRGRRILLVGTGTSWHAANQGAAFLRHAGQEAWAVQAADCATTGPAPGPDDALVLLSHRGTKRYTSTVVERARTAGVPTVQISGRGSPGADLETVEQETSAAFTASHLGALARLAQIATALGADLGPLASVPDAVAEVLARPPLGIEAPARLLELTGAGPNQWTAAEGALKVRETCGVAAEGLAVEQFLHGPSVALGESDALVVLDGGGPLRERLEEVATLVESYGSRVHRFREDALGELLSVFPLTAIVQRIALELAEALGRDPDAFGRDLPGRAEALGRIVL
jgi:glucosamine--fructose-6-phosphate aminotransferase (isomerizing)